MEEVINNVEEMTIPGDFCGNAFADTTGHDRAPYFCASEFGAVVPMSHDESFADRTGARHSSDAFEFHAALGPRWDASQAHRFRLDRR